MAKIPSSTLPTGKTRLVEILAGIGAKKITPASNITSIDVATSRYVASIKAQMQDITRRLTTVVNEIERVTGDILLEALEPTFQLSQEYVPYDTGALHDSGYLEKQEGGGLSRVVMGYAKGGQPDYAIMVHERVDIQHRSPERSKFLLAALEEDSGNIIGRIEDALKF